MVYRLIVISILLLCTRHFALAAPGKLIVTESKDSFVKLGYEVHESVHLSGGSSKLTKRSEILENRKKYEERLLRREDRKMYYSNTTSEVVIKNHLSIAYMVDIELGVPRQSLNVQLDTGSSDLWVYSSLNPFCSTVNCLENGVYDSQYSNTSNFTGELFNIDYQDTTFATGSVYRDALTVGDYSLDNFQFGVANDSNSSSMVFGIGLKSLESFSEEYDNFPLRLHEDGYIERPVYSLYLNNVNATSGVFLAGAVDTSKFEGQLSVCPLVNLGGTAPSAFYITSNGFNITNSTTSETEFELAIARHPLIFDAGSSELYLPDPVFASLGTAFTGISFIEGLNQYVAECSILNRYSLLMDICGSKYDIPLGFLGMRISQLEELHLLNLDSSNKFLRTGDYCALQIAASGSNAIQVGDSLMRYFYVYFDVEKMLVGVAKATFDALDSETIVPVTGDLPTSAITAPLSKETYAGSLSTPALSDGSEKGPSKSAPSGKKGLTSSSSTVIVPRHSLLMTFCSLICVLFLFC